MSTLSPIFAMVPIIPPTTGEGLHLLRKVKTETDSLSAIAIPRTFLKLAKSQ